MWKKKKKALCYVLCDRETLWFGLKWVLEEEGRTNYLHAWTTLANPLAKFERNGVFNKQKKPIILLLLLLSILSYGWEVWGPMGKCCDLKSGECLGRLSIGIWQVVCVCVCVCVIWWWFYCCCWCFF
jgi:hypothetical protein